MEIDRMPEWLERRLSVFLDLAEAEGFAALAASAETAGRPGFEAFLNAHREAIDGMLGSEDAQCARHLALMPPRTRHLMLLAVLFRLRQAYCVSKALSDRGADMTLDRHPAYLAARAAEAAELIAASWPDYWPFEDVPDPFETS